MFLLRCLSCLFGSRKSLRVLKRNSNIQRPLIQNLLHNCLLRICPQGFFVPVFGQHRGDINRSTIKLSALWAKTDVISETINPTTNQWDKAKLMIYESLSDSRF